MSWSTPLSATCVSWSRRVIAGSPILKARYWFEVKRKDDAHSLVYVWLHFAGAPTVQAHSCGEILELVQADPYAAYDMDEYGETRVAPAQPPDLLASVVGQILQNAALIQGYSSQPSVGVCFSNSSATALSWRRWPMIGCCVATLFRRVFCST